MKKKKFSLSDLMRSKITWAVIAELLILLVCFIIISSHQRAAQNKNCSFQIFGYQQINVILGNFPAHCIGAQLFQLAA